MNATRATVLSTLVCFAAPVTARAGDGAATQPTKRKTPFERLALRQLERFDRERALLADKVKQIDVPYPFVRGVFHAHSHLSHDSDGTLAEIIAAAKATRTQVVGFTEHPSKVVDVVAANAAGLHDGVYVLAGTESNNELFWPGRDGEEDLRFVAHPEEVPHFDRARYAGMEIYNTHSDAIDEPMTKLLAALMLNLPAAIRHPEAAFCALLDHPASFLGRYDGLTRTDPFSGIAANDSHQNQGIRLVARTDGSVAAVDASGDTVWEGSGLTAGILRAAFGQSRAPTESKELVNVLFDPYEISMRHVGTFLQIADVNERTVRQALRTGRICLGFEIVAPLPQVGFWVERSGDPVGTVGDQLTGQHGLTLRCALPLEADIRILRDGAVIHRCRAARAGLTDLPPGVYRMEAFQTLAGEPWPWVISNPIYVRP